MSNRSGTFEKRISILFLAILVFLLVGCGPVKQRGIIQPATADQIAAGNAANGRDLFMGYAHFENDGPPCMGCHSVGTNGLLGGGALGPDLTNVTEKRNQTDLASILSNYGWTKSPVMEPIFSAHPLTQSEQADLIAFLNSSVGQPETNRDWVVIGISLAGFVAAVLALSFLYRNRLRGVRRALVNKAQKELL